MTDNKALEPFRIDISQADLDDLRHRLAHASWPLPVPATYWVVATLPRSA